MTLIRTGSKWNGVSLLLWLALLTAWSFSVFSVIEEFCLVSACRDAAGFTLFGFNMGLCGIAYFSALLLFLFFRKKYPVLELLLSAGVSAGVGAEMRLLWIQKYVIGAWCPLCVTICCSLCGAAAMLVFEKVTVARTGGAARRPRMGWIALIISMITAGLLIAVLGVQALP